jgi:hypothetical protein
MTVQELINELLQEPNKNKPVYIYDQDNCINKEIVLVDFDISDRLDINVSGSR